MSKNNETAVTGERISARGYALVNSRNDAFSWHPTLADANTRLDFERNVYGRSLRIVKDVEATWPQVEA